jgi:hypothetical protein
MREVVRALWSLLLSLVTAFGGFGAASMLRLTGDESLAEQLAPKSPSTPMLDRLSQDWRGKVEKLEIFQEDMKAEIADLRRDVAHRDDLTNRKLLGVESRVGMLEHQVEEVRNRQDEPPVWLESLVEEQKSQMEGLRAEIKSLKDTSRTAAPSAETTKLPTRVLTSSDLMPGVHLTLTLKCGCTGQLELTQDGRWVLQQLHRDGKVKRLVLTPVASHEDGGIVLGSLANGMELSCNAQQTSFRLVRSTR